MPYLRRMVTALRYVHFVGRASLVILYISLSTFAVLADDEATAFDDFQRVVQSPSPKPGQKDMAATALAAMDKGIVFEQQYPQSSHLTGVHNAVKKTLGMVFGYFGVSIPPNRTADVEACTRRLLVDNTKDDGLQMVLFRMALKLPVDQQRPRLKELATGPAGGACSRAQALLSNLDRIGHPLELSFTSTDGRLVSSSNLKGKVLLIDFWAPSCGPCVRDFPALKALYKKFKSEGLEIIGLSKDPDEKALKNYLHKQPLPWPVKYDGSDSAHRISDEYRIIEIPVAWLVDRRGVLRDINGRDDQEQKVESLLKEK